MAKCVVAMFDAANWLCEYADLPAKKTDSDDGVVREKSAFVSGSIERYAEATIAACNLCKDVVDMRIEQIQKLQYMLDYLKGDDSDVVLPPNTFDNDTQVVNIMLWKELPGVIDRKLLGPNNVSTLTLAGFKELLQNSEHINE
ncbi:hypothetical protein EV175_003051 [Coemansia sp. RSA 1933]|nr:hypothetical protein EV175_003051 [Coemansia sp. RSA 1933]